MSNRQPDVIVIGAGVIGLFTAWELVDAGLHVTVIERGEIGREASWAGGGILSPLHPWRYPQAVLTLANWSQTAYPTIARNLFEATGIDPEWTMGGMLLLEPDSVAEALVWAQQAHAELEVLTASEQIERFPNIAPVDDAILLPSVAQVRNPRLLKALAAFLHVKGVQFLTGFRVERIVVEQGHVRGVQTDQRQISAARVVVTAGAWSAEIEPLQLPIKPIKGQMLLFSPTELRLPVMAMRDEVYLIPRRDGRVLVGSSMEDVSYDKTPTDSVKQHLHQQATAIFPALANANIERHWAGLRPGSPDGVPYISGYPSIEGLYVNSGHFRHGLLTAPASARLLADLILQRPPIISPVNYRLI